MSKAATNLLEFLPMYQEGKNDKNENRDSKYNALKLAKKYADSGQVLQEDVVAEFKRKGYKRTISYPLINHQEGIVTQADFTSCESNVTTITTAKGTLITVPYQFEFTMQPEEFYDNTVQYGAAFKTKYEAHSRKFAETLNLLVLSNLEAAQNTYFPASLTSAYWGLNGALNAFAVPNSDYDDIYNQMDGVLDDMDWDLNGGQKWDVLGTNDHNAKIRRFSEQGSANNTNLNFQYPDYNFIPEKSLSRGDGAAGAAMVIKPNTMWIGTTQADEVNRRASATDGKSWRPVVDPKTGLAMGSLFSSKCVNGKQLESFQYYTKVSIALDYNSDLATRYQPIVKIEVLAA